MCGICGILSFAPGDTLANITRQMADHLRHRGPDEGGIWVDQKSGVALGHRRLSIMDLSDAGAQPMISPCDRYIIVFNGEIYNHLAMRDELSTAGALLKWRGSSDTETLLAAVTHWGLRGVLRRSQGMFALALWDRQSQRLHLARDRLGEKPLYVARLDNGWIFGSELKALLAVPGFDARLCKDAVGAYLTYGYVPETHCIFQDVQKVPPGQVMTISAESATCSTDAYETFGELLDRGFAARNSVEPQTLDDLEATLGQVVEEQMLSDVPLGCFLSGGVDSSLVAALMQNRSTRPVRTFALGFSEERFNEAPHAAAVARHLGTEHTEFILSEEDALVMIAQLPRIYDEPFADSSQLPTALLCREARNSVTVALTGDGGDEVFGGYNRHIIGPQLLSRLQRVPRGLRSSVGRIASAFAPAITSENGWPRRIASSLHLPITALDKATQLAPHLGDIDDLGALYQHFSRGIHNPTNLMRDARIVTTPEHAFPVTGAEWMMAMDSVTYLPGDILVKVDRAAMATSLETRAPFLDSRVVTAAWSLPLEMKIAGGRGKQALRLLLDRHVPRDLIDRPKQGFAIPLDRWLRGELRGWAEAHLSDDGLIEMAGLEPDAVRELWSRHQAGRANKGTQLWTILMLLSWLMHYSPRLARS